MAVKSVRGVLLLILLTLVCTGACRSDQAYNLRILPGFAQSPGWKARDINDAGQVAGYTTTGQAVFCEANGLVRELTRPSGYISCGIHGINNAGDCVGYAEDASGNGCGVLWRADGTPVLLPALPGDYQCVAVDVNDSGQSVGVSRGQQDRAVIWDRDGNVTDLAALAGGWPWSMAVGVNNAGQVVGWLDVTGQTAFLWTGQDTVDLGESAGRPSCAWAVNNHSEAVGWAGGGEPVFWHSDGTCQKLESPDEVRAMVWGISDLGLAVGWLDMSFVLSQPFVNHAAVWRSDGTLLDIHPSGFASSRAYGINGGGEIVGGCTDAGGITYAVVWEPVPEPCSAAAVAAGLAALAGLAHRRRA